MIRFCSLFSGSSGNALFISAGGKNVLVDAGVSARRIEQALRAIGEDPARLDALLVTHEHSDHSRCLGVLARRFRIPVYANEATWRRMIPWLGRIEADQCRRFITGQSFDLGELQVLPFAIPHDAVDPVAFSFFCSGRKLTTATDIGHVNEELFTAAGGSDLLMLEANHDLNMLDNGSYPLPLKQRIRGAHGHLCNDSAGEFLVRAARAGMKRFILGHLSGENNLPELAYATVCGHLAGAGFSPGRDFELEVAPRDGSSRVFSV